MLRVLARVVLGVLAIFVLAVALFAAYVAEGWHAEAHLDGSLAGLPVREHVVVIRDARGIPHIRAQSMHDLMVAQGYVEASDRLFQIDLLRHFVYGRLAEWFGPQLLEADKRARTFDVARVIATEYERLTAGERDQLSAFADGINAAMAREPLPVEYRLAVLHPETWRPEDTLAVGFATVLALTDSWDDVIERERVHERFGDAGTNGLYSITDPRYDVPITDGPVAPVPPLPSLEKFRLSGASAAPRHARGSNEWAVGAVRSQTGRALLANDPHLDITMPGVWYLVDLQAPGFHVAGATLAGTAGVILGHNEHIAWGATNGSIASASVYRSRNVQFSRHERFHVRFGRDAVVFYDSDANGFSPVQSPLFSVDWPAATNPVSPATTFDRLDRATTVETALAALRIYPGPTQNFVLADTRGYAAYHMAGDIPNDPLWAQRVHAAQDPHYPPVPFDRLPHVDPSRDAIVFTANNRVYGKNYPLLLTAWFEPPYRAARVAQLLRSRKTYDVAYFSEMQRDALSLPERELTAMTLHALRRQPAKRRNAANVQRAIRLLEGWDGRFLPDSEAASLVYDLRTTAVQRFISGYFLGAAGEPYRRSSDVFVVMMRALRERPKGYFPNDDADEFLVQSFLSAATSTPRPWREAGAIPVRHVFSFFGMPWLDGRSLPGDGDAYTVHAQLPYAGQSFRAVWDIGNWDAGGIVIPSGESGRPGSVHHDDAHATWVDQTLVPLPFSEEAVAAAARHRLVLAP